jgi:hypothetical protein
MMRSWRWKRVVKKVATTVVAVVVAVTAEAFEVGAGTMATALVVVL